MRLVQQRAVRHRCLRSLRVNEDGSFTLEASLVFPLILFCTVTLLFVGMYAYQNVFVQQLARTTAERLAFTWNNSHKDLVTGNFNPSETDGLYWRLTRDGVSDLFGMLSGSGTTEVLIPSGSTSGHVESKLANSSALLPQGVTGTAKYANYLFDHQVEVKLKKSFLMPAQLKRWLGSEQTTGKAVSHVVESVELIRLTDITRTYFKAIKGRISPQKARDALVEPIQGNLSGPSVTIKSERQAAAYLKSLVGGTEVILKTTSGKSRTIDALDARGIGHQAFYNMTEFQLRTEQLPKDLELLDERAQVKGIVWHFFKKDASGKGMPSNSFRKELERKGIVVVIHN
ncbi:pilus assembly protein [Paenibacillus alginolyticus]|uniref:Pilus assembly protein n=1 Tax=Paenibacillus alginolyticus TaxID=59839 RepID=A0ABT4G9Y8_9BACL|nr:TadE family protein [Paenibacillus alginolyticus]MCY9664257.1 pilus assembly protein [Paenibacillus alginolyticus]MCY9692974.1 pilus assembly protein [Paenibacillus alginolyticus]